MSSRSLTVRKARIVDVPVIHAMVNDFASRGDMLGRSRSELYECIRDFFVAESGGGVVGCSALHVDWEDLAEVRSVAVDPGHQGSGIGRALVDACVREARDLGITRVYALTYRPGFFERMGFHRVEKESLPHKVWGECMKCPKYPDCDEDAVIMEVER